MLNLIERIVSVITVPTSSRDLRRSQFRAFTTQIPILYFILVTNTISVALTHQGVAPAFLSTWLPATLCIVSLIRILVWIRGGSRELDDSAIAQKLRHTLLLVVLFGASFTTWGLAIFPYGDAYARVHVAFYMAVTVIGCIFCLMHLRTAALACTLIVNIPFVLFFANSGNGVLIAISVNVLLVSLAMVFILLTYNRDFSQLVHSRSEVLEIQKATQKLSDENFQLANLDSLTGLPNRRAFFASVDLVLEHQLAEGMSCCIGIIDLDGFKQVNDVYGHNVGDRVIEETGRRLARFNSPTATLARLGGDEFGLLVVCEGAFDQAMAISELICAALRKPFEHNDMTAQLSASIGLTRTCDGMLNAALLLDRADYALYFAKESNRGEIVVFSAEHEVRIRRESRLRQALKSPNLAKELSLAYQPIVNVSTREIVSYEALARWNHGDLGNVSPGEFIPLAERSGMITDITVTLLSRALIDAAAWPNDRRLSFNLSACDVSCERAISRILELVNASRFDASRLDFEVTETAVMRDFAQARKSLGALRALGAGVSLDDFGTGYSSLNSLHQLPLDKIKIDGSFVRALNDDPTVAGILGAVLSFCGKLGVECVAEGVETDSEMRALSDIGYTTMQGYLFGVPKAHLALGCRSSEWPGLDIGCYAPSLTD